MRKISLIIGLNAVNGEINFLDMKGIDAIIHYPGASPVYGYVAWKTFLPNHRFYGNYGVSSRGFFCSGAEAADLKANKDCPLDSNAELVQRMFPSLDGSNFVANQLDKDIVSRLRGPAIGAILERIALFPSDMWWDDGIGNTEPRLSAFSELEEDLVAILGHYLNLKGTYNAVIENANQALASRRKAFEKRREKSKLPKLKISDLSLDQVITDMTITKNRILAAEATNQRLEEALREFEDHLAQLTLIIKRDRPHDLSNIYQEIYRRCDLDSPAMHPIRDRLDSIWWDLRSLQVAATTLRDSPNVVEWGTRDEFTEFAKLLIAAVRESRNSDDYPLFFPEQTLLGFFVAKMETKADIVELLDAMPSLRHPIPRASFLLERWSPADYDPTIVVEQAIDWSPERILFHTLMYEVQSRVIPRLVSYSKVTHLLDDGKTEVSYADCGETSLRNFFNAVTYDRNALKLNADILRRIQRDNSEDVSVMPALLDFYDTFKSMSSITTQKARTAWAKNVVSQRGSTIMYRKNDAAEIRSMGNMDNMFRLIGQLLLTPSKLAEWNSNMNRADRLNFLIKIISQTDRVFGWSFVPVRGSDSLESSSTDRMTIRFTLNGKPLLDWIFYAAHFAILDLSKSTAGETYSWKDEMGNAILNRDDMKFAGDLLPLFVDDMSVEDVIATCGSDLGYARNLAYAVDYSDYERRLAYIQMFLTFHVSSVKTLKSINLKSLIERLAAQLPQDIDPHTRRELNEAFLDAEYPLGIPEHAIGLPEARYSKVTGEELIRIAGTRTAVKRIGECWKRTFFGTDIVITDVIGGTFDPDNIRRGIPSFSFEEAVDVCLSLNPPEVRGRVLSQMIARAIAMKSIRGDPWNDEQALTDIYQSMPVEGFFMLGVEIFHQMLTEMSASGIYIRQFLPHLRYSSWTFESHFDSMYDLKSFPEFHYELVHRSTTTKRRVRCGIETARQSTAGNTQGFSDWRTYMLTDDDGSAPMLKNRFRFEIYGKRVVIGDPPIAKTTSWEAHNACLTLNGDRRDIVESELKKRSDFIRYLWFTEAGWYSRMTVYPAVDEYNSITVSGYAPVTWEQWEEIFRIIRNNHFDSDFIQKFFDPISGCDFWAYPSHVASCLTGYLKNAVTVVGEIAKVKCAYIEA